MGEAIKVWYDAEGDFVEVLFKRKAGTYKETSDDQVMVKVDPEGNVLGFSILNFSTVQNKPLDLSLTA